MNGEVLKTFTEELLGGRSVDETLFYQLLNNAKNRRERRRKWMKLRTRQASQTLNSSNTYQTEFTLPTGFIFFYSKTPVHLVGVSDSSVMYKLEEIPFEQLDEKQDQNGYFAVDYSTNKFYVTGTWDKDYTVKIYHTAHSTDIAAGTTWVFGDDYTMALAFDVALQEKGDISYDEINARMAKFHGKSIDDIDQAMVMWDSNLQVASRGL